MEHFAARANAKTIPLHPVTTSGLRRWLAKQPKPVATWLKSTEFNARPGQRALVPGREGALERVVVGVASDVDPWSYAALPTALPRGRYALATADTLAAEAAYAACLGWALGTYRFARYKAADRPCAELVWPATCDRAAVERAASAVFLGRDLINTPAEDMGPAELADASKRLAAAHGGKLKTVTGKQLLTQGYPIIHAVGRAAAPGREPRLIDIRWGSAKAPKLTLVGKGIVFDSGGLDIKPSAGMRLMKKDMGGAATVLAVAKMVMAAKLPVRLRVLIAAAENAVSGGAFRPGDVLPTRKGVTVEVGNTDAEGRLVLADALTEAASEQPDLIVNFATLTGASRVALGTELPGLFCTDDGVADALISAGLAAHDPDPLWRMPLHEPYRAGLDSSVADLCNISNQPYGGAITAALFLREFVGASQRWAHIDTMAWYLAAKPGRPVGGEVMGARAAFNMLAERYSSRRPVAT